jgi:hypothetical protein
MLVIGNGESRSNIDLNKFNCQKIGCNAIHRDHAVRHIVCVDRKMVCEAIDKGVNSNSIIYTRQDWFLDFADQKNIKEVPVLPYVGNERVDSPINWGSGPYAVLLAAKLVSSLKYQDNVHMIGFDLYGTKDGKINNIYKDTKNYNLSIKKAVDPRYWIYQISKVFETFPNVKFFVYVENNWKIPDSWKLRNVHITNINCISYDIT